MLFLARFMCLVNFVSVVHEVYGQRISEFRFTTQQTPSLFLNPSSNSQGSCNVCYGSNDCVAVAASWCEYYQRTTGVLAEEEEQETAADPVLRAEVDTALYNILQTAAEDSSFTECIPYVSHYTNCDKESICSGCQSCSCDGGGRWRCGPGRGCGSGQGCGPGAPRRNVDRRLLQRAMERLAGIGTQQERVKRSFRDLARQTGRDAWMDENRSQYLSTTRPVTSTRDDASNPTPSDVVGLKEDSTTLFHKLARWMQAVRPRSLASITVTPDREEVRDIIRTIFEDMQNNRTIGYKLFGTEKLNDELENFSFNELLNSNFPINSTGYNTSNKDYDSSDFTKLLSEMEGLNEVLDETTTATYENFYKNMRMLKNAAINSFSSGNVIDDLFDNDISPDRSTRILKREVVNAVNETTSNNNVTVNSNVTTAINLKNLNSTLKVLDSNHSSNLLKNNTDDDVENISKTQKDMNENVLSPLVDIIIQKQNELAELLNIRNHLISNIKSNKNLNFSSNIADDLKENKTHFEIYKLEITPESSREQSDLKKYMGELNNDVLKMVLEISAIQRLLKEQKVIVPINFKRLSNAIKLYIQELKDSKDKTEKRDLFNSSNILKNKRDKVKGVASYIESGFLNVLEMMDKINTSNILAPLSKNAIKIFKRLILSLTDSINSSDIKFAENTQITSNLEKAQYEWQKIEGRPRNTHVSNSLHDLKLEHLAVTCVVNELTQLLYQINFFQSRRMIPLDLDQIETTVNEISQMIESRMGSIHDNFNHEKLFPSSTSSSMFSDDASSTTTKPQERKRNKLSFLKRLKKMMKKFMPKKIPKQTEEMEIHKAKFIAMHKDINDYENTKDWENNAKPRNKRSPHGPPERVKFRLQNILPKYLRRKFHHNGLKKDTKNCHKKGKSKREVTVVSKMTQLPWWLREDETTQLPWWRNHTRVTIVTRPRLKRRPQKHVQKKRGVFAVIRDRIAEFFSG